MKEKITFFLLMITSVLIAQQKRQGTIPDSLLKFSFATLEERINSAELDLKKKEFYTEIYYKKAIIKDNPIDLANALYLKALISQDKSNTLQYADAIIALTKNSNDFNFPAKGYILKGNFFLINLRLQEALENIFVAKQYSEKSGNLEQKLLINRYIGLVKIELGKPAEALPLFEESHRFFKSKPEMKLDLIFVEWVMSDIYIRLGKIDTALFYIYKALRNLEKGNPYYRYFEMYKGICCHLKKDFSQSNLFLNKSIPLLKEVNDPLNLAVCYYYKGENILKEEVNPAKAKVYYEKVDSILVVTKKYSRDLRDNYIRLIEISRDENDDKRQLYYLNRLIDIDGYFHKNKISLSESINKNYDTPRLFAEKEKLITKINQEKKIILGFGGLLGIALGFALFYLIKVRREKLLFEERFNKLIQIPLSEIESAEEEPIENLIVIKDGKAKLIAVPKEIVREILKKLTQFENEKGYLKPNIKQTDFARELDTNSSYLSKVINHYKGKNFSQYINDLRIDFAIKRLMVDKKFRKYTIKAISEDVGFTNTESFGKAFYAKTGLQPSYFIKKLEENNSI